MQKDKVGKLVVLDEDDYPVELEVANNFLDVAQSGLSLYKYWKVAPWYSLIMRGTATRVSYTSDNAAFADATGCGCIFAASNDIRLGRTLNLGLDIREAVSGLYDYRRNGNSFYTDASLTYTHEKSGLQLKVEVTDIFKTSSPAYEYDSSGVRQRYENYYDSRALEVSLLWEFGNRFNEIRHNSSFNAEERSRL